MRASQRPDESDRRPRFARAIGRRSVSPHLASTLLGIFASHWYRDHLWNLFKSLFPKTCIDAASTLRRWHPISIGTEVKLMEEKYLLNLPIERNGRVA